MGDSDLRVVDRAGTDLASPCLPIAFRCALLLAPGIGDVPDRRTYSPHSWAPRIFPDSGIGARGADPADDCSAASFHILLHYLCGSVDIGDSLYCRQRLACRVGAPFP